MADNITPLSSLLAALMSFVFQLTVKVIITTNVTLQPMDDSNIMKMAQGRVQWR